MSLRSQIFMTIAVAMFAVATSWSAAQAMRLSRVQQHGQQDRAAWLACVQLADDLIVANAALKEPSTVPVTTEQMARYCGRAKLPPASFQSIGDPVPTTFTKQDGYLAQSAVLRGVTFEELDRVLKELEFDGYRFSTRAVRVSEVGSGRANTAAPVVDRGGEERWSVEIDLLLQRIEAEPDTVRPPV